MPKLPLRRGEAQLPAKPTAHRCKQCRAELSLVRRHVSPPRLGDPLTTEFYLCVVCDSGYALNLAAGTWKPWTAEDA